ncbi:HNH endonuclease [Streptomyces mirabilis]|uniref:HNH endonuclease n=2 Tax=Streptomyces mirabilis TaxID=68239 RepID=UPI002255A3CF|nr:HNH endonuclease [Streptomyces mirabilis]MCX4423900.1 HNH endonuclease [Streptomyces mirabilis]
MPVDASEHDESRAPDGTPWWELSIRPGTKKQRFGQECRLAAWLWFKKNVGDTFTMRELRAALGPDIAETSEHLNRRLRELRKCDWVIPSQRNDATLAQDEYRLETKGGRLWIDSERAKYEKFAPSARVRRFVMDRDGSRCKICGAGVDEEYPGEPGTKVRLTIGHLVPQERLRSRGVRDDMDNWRVECSRCNETVRDEAPDPEQYDEVLAGLKRLTSNEARELLAWMRKGERPRSKVDQAYDRARKLPHSDREALVDHLAKRVGEIS